jgi:hypothetical protein
MESKSGRQRRSSRPPNVTDQVWPNRYWLIVTDHGVIR